MISDHDDQRVLEHARLAQPREDASELCVHERDLRVVQLDPLLGGGDGDVGRSRSPGEVADLVERVRQRERRPVPRGMRGAGRASRRARRRSERRGRNARGRGRPARRARRPWSRRRAVDSGWRAPARGCGFRPRPGRRGIRRSPARSRSARPSASRCTNAADRMPRPARRSPSVVISGERLLLPDREEAPDAVPCRVGAGQDRARRDGRERRL